MADETVVANNSAPAETPAAAEPELALDPEISAEPASDEQPLEGQAIEDELEEAEVDGKKGKVSKALKEFLTRDADYRRKPQEVADQRKAHEAAEKTLAERTETFTRHAREVGKLMALNDQLAEYEKYTPQQWQQWLREQPVEANAARAYYDDLLRQRGSLAQQLHQQEQKWQIEAQSETTKRLEEGRKAIAAKVPGWSPTMEADLQKYATTQGFSAAEWAGVSDHRAVTVLNKARLYDQLVAKHRAATQAAASAPVVPSAPVGGQRAPSNSLRELAKSEDNTAYAKARFGNKGRQTQAAARR